jgi:hypothetical protein
VRTKTHDAEDVKEYNRHTFPKTNLIIYDRRTQDTSARGAATVYRAAFVLSCYFCVLFHFCGVVFCLNILFRLNVLLSVCLMSYMTLVVCVLSEDVKEYI